MSTIVNTEAMRALPPPPGEVGIVAWVRTNLVRSWFDTLLTAGFGAFIVAVSYSFLNWAVGQANWFVVIFNLRLMLFGRYPLNLEWRVWLFVAISAFTIGISLAAWTHIKRRIAVIMLLVIGVLFGAPPLIDALIPLGPSFLGVGGKEITQGASAETPQSQLAFIARAGERVGLRIASEFSTTDQNLSGLVGFADRAAALLANSAATRLDAASQQQDLQTRLSSDLLTAGQRTRLQAQLAQFTVSDSIADTYNIGQGTFKVSILRGTQMIATGTLSKGSEPLSVDLPADGWYVLQKMPASESDTSTAILEARGIGPLLQRETAGDAGSSVIGGTAFQYIRVTDNFTTNDPRPTLDDRNVPMALLIDNGYRDSRMLSDFLRLYLSQLFKLLGMPVLLLIFAGSLGYWVGRLVDRYRSPDIHPRKTSRRAAVWLLMALPVVMFGLIYGVGTVLPLTDTRRWGGLLLTIMLTVVSSIASFPLGILLALGRRSRLPVVSIASTIYIEVIRGVPLITVLFMAQLLLPLMNPALAEMPNVFRAMIAITLFGAAYMAENVRGGLQSIPVGQNEAAKALGLSSFQITFEILLPQALRAVFPALVGMVISGFKDTSLVAIVGLLDLTGIAQTIVTQTEFIGQRRETLLVITIFYFSIAYAIAAVSRRIETSGFGATVIRKL